MARRKQFAKSASAAPSIIKLVVASIGIAALFSCCQSPRKEGATNLRSLPPMPAPYTSAPPAVRIVDSAPSRNVEIASVRVEAHVGTPHIRVAALKDAPSVRIAGGPAGARVLSENNAEIRRLPPSSALLVAATPAGLSLDGGAQTFSSLRIESLSPSADLQLNEQDMAPSIQLVRAGKNGVTAIAHIDLESYLCGVLAGEVPFNKWHSEALKAQAITSRSYAYHQIRQHAGEAYDVEATIMSQVFKPGFRTNPILSAAVGATRALVLTERGDTFSAYFHSTCGGQTESSLNVFPEHPKTGALGGTSCGYCTPSPHYRW